MTTNFSIKPDVPPELSNYTEELNRSILENKSCIDFLTKNGVSTGTLLNWSTGLESQEKKSSIFIPGNDLNGSPIIIKFVNNTKGNLIEQCLQQLRSLDEFILRLKIDQRTIKIYLLLVVSYKQDCHTEFCEAIEDIKKTLVGKEESGFLKCVQTEVCHVRKKEKENSLNTVEEKVFSEILSQSIGENQEAARNPITEAMVSVVPTYQHLHVSDAKYNSNEDEPKIGFSLKSVDKVIQLLQKFFPSCEKELCIFPNFDSTPGSILHKTSKEGKLNCPKANDFMGEQVNFREQLLGNLNNPKGLLIYHYTQKELNEVIQNPYTINFELDWILCSSDKIYGIEISTKNSKNDSTAIRRKIVTVFSTTLPKFNFIISSLLSGGFEDKKKFLENSCEFILYFTNILSAKIKTALKNCQTNRDEVWNILEAVSENNIQKVTVLCPEDATLLTTAPAAYKIVKKESFWTLEKSKCTIEAIFSCDDSEISLKNTGSPPLATTADDKRKCQYISGLLCFGFLIRKFSISQPAQKGLPWHTKLENQIPDSCAGRTKLKKNEGRFFESNKKYCGLVLSPQQLGILKEDLKYFYIIGEPGSGKTVILLAKLIDASKDEQVDTIVFFFPETKTDFEQFVLKFIHDNVEPEWRNKIYVTTINKIAGLMKTLKTSRTVVLGDELYLDPNDHWSSKQSPLFEIIEIYTWLPLVKQCWIANTEAGQDSKRQAHRSSLPHFKTKTLNILFRNSWHIGSFCTGNLHKNVAISKSTSWVFGCTNSSQMDVFCETYTDLKNLKGKLKDCKELRPHFDKDRMTVIFTAAEKRSEWESEQLSEILPKVGDLRVVVDGETLSELSFTGIEKSSVLLIIDFCSGKKGEEIKRNFQLYTAAASRAQFELSIFTASSEYEKIGGFLSVSSPTEGIVKAARLGWPFDLKALFPNEKREQDEVVKANQILAIAVQRQNCGQLREVMAKMQPVDIDLRQVLGALDVQKEDNILEAVKETLGSCIKSVFEKAFYCRFFPLGKQFVDALVGLANVGIRAGLTKNVDCLVEIIEDDLASYYYRKSGKVIFLACMNGSYDVIEWAVKTTEKFKLLEKEMRSLYDTWAEEQITLVLFLCHMNIDDMKCIRLLRDKGFPKDLLRHTFGGRNALEKALYYQNLEMTRELIRDNTWARTFISSEEDFNKMIQLTNGNPEISKIIKTRFE